MIGLQLSSDQMDFVIEHIPQEINSYQIKLVLISINEKS